MIEEPITAPAPNQSLEPEHTEAASPEFEVATEPLFKAKCPKCGKVFKKRSQTKADQAVRMHVGRSHSRNIPTYMGGAKPKTAKATRQEAPKQKRQYIKRNPPVTGTVTINFCPKCGTDLHKIATAVVLAGKLGQ